MAILRGVAFLAALVAAILAIDVAHAFDPARGEPMLLETDATPVTAETAKGPVRFSVEIADEPLEASAGLMYRRSMEADHGMLFVFPAPRQGSFWMANTILPLDIIFVREDGVVANIVHGQPNDPTPLLSQGPIRYVLELNAGMAQKAGIVAGVRLRHPRIAAGT